MLQNIIDLLKVYDSYGENEIIDFAKGNRKAAESWSEFRENIKKIRKWQKK